MTSTNSVGRNMSDKLDKTAVRKFRREVYEYYSKNGRTLPWRNTKDPYKILVSEIMLQQTQVSRVLIKYKSFLKKFPTVKALTAATVRDVLIEWQGLGYNRRAIYLKKAAEEVVKRYKGKFPKTCEELLELPGIGQSTAGALLAFSYGMPAVFIETNIRSVFIHFFFKDSSSISDNMIRDAVEQTLEISDPRNWYYALYDYGTFLKSSKDQQVRRIHQKSKHYKKQSAFKGSNREIRSTILKYLLEQKSQKSSAQICSYICTYLEKEVDNTIINTNLSAMMRDGLIQKSQIKDLWQAV